MTDEPIESGSESGDGCPFCGRQDGCGHLLASFDLGEPGAGDFRCGLGGGALCYLHHFDGALTALRVDAARAARRALVAGRVRLREPRPPEWAAPSKPLCEVYRAVWSGVARMVEDRARRAARGIYYGDHVGYDPWSIADELDAEQGNQAWEHRTCLEDLLREAGVSYSVDCSSVSGFTGTSEFETWWCEDADAARRAIEALLEPLLRARPPDSDFDDEWERRYERRAWRPGDERAGDLGDDLAGTIARERGVSPETAKKWLDEL